jgi:hypothetical protein
VHVKRGSSRREQSGEDASCNHLENRAVTTRELEEKIT